MIQGIILLLENIWQYLTTKKTHTISREAADQILKLKKTEQDSNCKQLRSTCPEDS